eukprot:5055974-Pleurochrysis_carterae.AAC.4
MPASPVCGLPTHLHTSLRFYQCLRVGSVYSSLLSQLLTLHSIRQARQSCIRSRYIVNFAPRVQNDIRSCVKHARMPAPCPPLCLKSCSKPTHPPICLAGVLLTCAWRASRSASMPAPGRRYTTSTATSRTARRSRREIGVSTHN